MIVYFLFQLVQRQSVRRQKVLPEIPQLRQIHLVQRGGGLLGGPFKDTSGPSINILIKLMTVVSLVFASIFSASGLL